MMKNKMIKVALGSALAVAGTFGIGQAAFASTSVPIDRLNTPGGYGYWTGHLDWNSAKDVQEYGSVHDVAADGHGPYFHIIAWQDNGIRYQFDHEHDDAGYPSYVNTIGEDSYFGAGNIEWVDVWACNGGDINGHGVEGGCYGRRYYNQYVYPSRGSSSLGTTTGTID